MVVIPLDRPISVRQIERFLVLAWDSGAEPVLLLTKTDLISEQELILVVAEVSSVSGEVAIMPVSVVTGDGMETWRDWCTPSGSRSPPRHLGFRQVLIGQRTHGVRRGAGGRRPGERRQGAAHHDLAGARRRTVWRCPDRYAGATRIGHVD